MTDVQRREYAALAAALAEKRAFYESGQTEFAIGYEDAAWDGKPEVAIEALLAEVDRLKAENFDVKARLLWCMGLGADEFTKWLGTDEASSLVDELGQPS